MNSALAKLIDSASNTVDVATEIVKTFADKLGVSVSEVWKALCTKTVIEGYWQTAIFAFISLIFLVALLLSFGRTIIKVRNEGWEENGPWGNAIITFAMGLLLLGSTYLTSMGITKIYVPQYYAAQDVYTMWNNYVNPPNSR